MDIPDDVLLETDAVHRYEILISADNSSITLVTATTHTSASCPLCRQPSQKVHSQYCRVLADLPWACIPVHILLNTRRFFCDNPVCKRVIFTERLPELAAPWARRTNRLVETQRQIALAAGGAGGSKPSCQLGMGTGTDILCI